MKSQSSRSVYVPSLILKYIECSSCCKRFHVKCSQELRAKNAYLLNCGHSICDMCHQKIGTTVTSCKTCNTPAVLTVQTNDSVQTLQKNAYLIGRACMANKQAIKESFSYYVLQKLPKNLAKQSNDSSNSCICYECSSKEATLNCQQCECSYCGECWIKVHSSGKSLMRHVAINISSGIKPKNTKYCGKHVAKLVEFFCGPCKSYLCADCVLADHERHEILLLKEKNRDLLNIVFKVKNEVQQHITKMEETAKLVKQLRETALIQGSSYVTLQRQVVQHFVHLHGVLQVAEESVLQKLKNAENSSVFRLEEILIQLETQIRGCKRLVKEAQDARVSDSMECSVALEDLLENMNSAVGLPSQLVNSGPEKPLPNQAPLVSFNESVVDALRNFCTLNLPEDNLYELRICDCPEKMTPKNVTADENVAKTDGSNDLKGSDTSMPKPIVPTLVPQATTKSLQSIMKGQPYSVNICYVKDPGEFYVIRSSLRRHQKKLDDRARISALQCIMPTKVEKDEYYLVHYITNKNWYRGRAISVTPPTNKHDEPMVLIYYIDYGNTESVPLSRLRLMPQQLKMDAPMALKCRLFDCTPKKGTWCKASTKAMLEVLNNTVLTMYVMKILPDVLEVDLCCRNRDDQVDSTLVSLRDTLVFLEYASFVSGPVRTHRALDANYLRQNLPKPGDSFSGVISHVVSSAQFYLQKIGPENQYLVQLTEKLNSTYDKNSQKFLIYNPIIGMICSALYPVDEKWYRARIVDLPGNEMVKVFFVDFGDEECVSWKCVRKLLPEFVKLVPQALRCSLSKVLHPSDLKWSSETKAYLENCTSDILTVHVASVTPTELKVVLLTKNNVCLNAELACADSPGEESLGAEEKFLPQPGENESISLKSKKNILSNSEDEHPEDTSEGYRMEVRILRVESPSDILVSIVCLEAKSEKLEGELQRFYKTSKPVNEAWQAGSKCAVLSKERSKWYRGCILEVLEDGKFRVELKDIGQVEDVPPSNVRVLAHRFLECPVSIMKCHLSGIFPPETEWPGLTCDFLISEVKNHSRVYITKADDNVNGSVPVILWVKEVANGGALEPTREEWISLNDLIVDQGLAVPAKAKLIFHKSESLESLTKVTPVKKSEKSDSSNVDSDSSAPSLASTDWIQPKPILKTEFVGKPTFVDSDGVISIYDIEDDGPVLDMIKNTLLEHYQHSKPKAQDQFWSVNQICVVKYYLDDCWYRGKVLKVNDDNTYSVLFVDYGNVEVCQVSEMRKNVRFYDIPVLSRKYELHGVTPVSGDGRWPSDTIDSLYSTIVDVTCKIKVVRKSNDPCIPSTIQLKLTGSDLDVAKVLELASLANYNRLDFDENEDASENHQKQGSYFNLELPPHCTSFPIDVLTVRLSSLSAHVVNNETVLPEIRKIICEFIDLTEDIQNNAESQPHLEQYTKGTPCVSLYTDNGKWYRAEVLNKSDDSNSILVQYVDYGNREYVTKDRVRECQPKWFKVPKMSLKCKLHNVRKSVNITSRDYIQSLTKCLSDYDLEATLIRKCGDYFEVEILKNQQLAYQTMIEEGLMEFIKKL